ncbi:PhnD/SsuA/transferrin family substrate-binding protein [Alicyclobacillus fructus]|uniref:PhnD/SsuA/transferrin family substrate-binding protein n=1 Tax=Alicyclobacillus fructus TaxID=2816082 RepID=UPI001A8ECA10|nr:PhnD/SsuA/transferrin family substrate-binding protein [Alicyclobacillus fructus]
MLGGSIQASHLLRRPSARHTTTAEFQCTRVRRASVALIVSEHSPNTEQRWYGWYEFTSGPPLLQARNSGSLDLGEVGGSPAVFAQATPGSQVAYVAYEPEVYRGILVPKQSNLNTLADLKGKKVAYAKGSSASFLVLAALNIL